MNRREKLLLIISGVIVLLASIGFGITLIIDHSLNGKYDLINDLQAQLNTANRDRRSSNDRVIYARLFRNTLDSFMETRDDIELKENRRKELMSDLRMAAALMIVAANALQEINDDELKALSEEIAEVTSPDELYNYKWKYSLLVADGMRKIETRLNNITLSIHRHRTVKLWILVLSILLNSFGLFFGILSIRYRGNPKGS